jgi:competence protein ComEC
MHVQYCRSGSGERSANAPSSSSLSGENVAFVLALAGPVLRRLPRRARFVAALSVLVVFGTMTRWEPSVLRACAMAACSLLAVYVGRPVAGIRALAIAVAVLLVVDPFLLHSVGFQLSCAACLGLALTGPWFTARLRGPAWFRESLGATLGAQLGVAPVLIPVFGSVPLVSLPANLLAVPLAGPLTVWGLAAGVAGGAVRPVAPPVARLLQLPTLVLVRAVMTVAAAGRADPAGGRSHRPPGPRGRGERTLARHSRPPADGGFGWRSGARAYARPSWPGRTAWVNASTI